MRVLWRLFEEKTSNVENSNDKANVEVSVTTNNDENELAEVHPLLHCARF